MRQSRRYFFTVKSFHKMKTVVTETSIEAYHAHPVKQGQALKVAEYAASETKHGRAVWIAKIADHFALMGHKDLGQKSTASARLKDIKERGVVIDGKKYRMEKVKEAVPPGGRCVVEMWFLVLDAPKEQVQLTMF